VPDSSISPHFFYPVFITFLLKEIIIQKNRFYRPVKLYLPLSIPKLMPITLLIQFIYSTTINQKICYHCTTTRSGKPASINDDNQNLNHEILWNNFLFVKIITG
jgi:hypothetical protein